MYGLFTYGFIAAVYGILLMLAPDSLSLERHWHDFVSFLGADLKRHTWKEIGSSGAASIIIGTCVLSTIFSLTLSSIVQAVIGKAAGGNEVNEVVDKYVSEGQRGLAVPFMAFLGTLGVSLEFLPMVVLEEFVFRLLLLGPVMHFPSLSGPVAFYALFSVSVALFALIHLINYKNARDRNLLRVLPQLVGGLFLTFVYVRLGIVASIITHVLYNAIALSATIFARTIAKSA